jgi:hypothetical protein
MNVGMSRDVLNSKTIVHDESGGENVQNIDNSECMEYNDNLDGMMNDDAMNFLDILEVFENLCNNSNIPLYSDCMKFIKISAIFKLYKLKAKNEWS